MFPKDQIIRVLNILQGPVDVKRLSNVRKKSVFLTVNNVVLSSHTSVLLDYSIRIQKSEVGLSIMYAYRIR